MKDSKASDTEELAKDLFLHQVKIAEGLGNLTPKDLEFTIKQIWDACYRISEECSKYVYKENKE